MKEIERIDKNNKGEIPEKTKMIITVSKVGNPEEVLAKTKEIMKCVSQFAFSKNWPDDKEWIKILPSWFVESMTNKSLEDIMKTKGQWHFESWVESMYHRAWVWWSSKIEKDEIIIVLETLNIPYLFEQFLYIFYAQGISMDNIKVVDDIYDKE